MLNRLGDDCTGFRIAINAIEETVIPTKKRELTETEKVRSIMSSHKGGRKYVKTDARRDRLLAAKAIMSAKMQKQL